MIEYTQDFSIPQVQELLVQKTINTKGVRQARLVFHLELAMLGLITLCLWLCADKFSFLFPLALAVLLIIGGGYKKSQEAGVRKDLRTEITSGDILRKVQVDEQGVRVCREDRDALFHWANFVGWGGKGPDTVPGNQYAHLCFLPPGTGICRRLCRSAGYGSSPYEKGLTV